VSNRLDATPPTVAYYPPIQPGAKVLIQFHVEATRNDGDLLKISIAGKAHWVTVDRVESIRS
jgi:hypothetical protein